MASIADIKELECADTPLFLFDCTVRSGDVYHWSTHNVALNGTSYEARILQQNLFEMRSSPDDATDGTSNISITLANADAYLSPIERTIGWKGARVVVTFVFFNLVDGTPSSDSRVVFRGIANAPDESNEAGLKLTFTNRLNLQRIYIPEFPVERRCPWMFPADAAQRHEALTGEGLGRYSGWYRCGYSADLPGGVGNLNGAVPFTTCDYSRTQCIQRGMFSKDANGMTTSRFGGIEYVPSSIVVRGYREKGSHVSTPVEGQALYDDCVPLVYGTGWYQPSIVFARNDGNLTRMEVLLGAGEITNILKVVVNDLEIPAGLTGVNMTATGWYKIISTGTRNGAFNPDFSNANGVPLGDPYGSIAYMSVVVPNAINNGQSLPKIQVLINGLKLSRFDSSGAPAGDDAFSNNPAWVLLDILCRSGWTLAEMDLASFAVAAAICDQPVAAMDLHGNETQIPRFQCNLILTKAKSASDVVRGVRNGSGLYLNFDSQGLLSVRVESTLAGQQPDKPQGSNSIASLDGGWPAYEFGDNSFSGIALRANGQSSLRVYSRSSANTPNQFTVEFQDEFNAYQQDSLSVLDAGDQVTVGQRISAALPVAGLPNYDQANRVACLFLAKSIHGNTYADFETSVRSVNLVPGDIITLTYAREGFSRTPFRVIRIAPAMNYQRALITAQAHDDAWYSASNAATAGTGRQGSATIGTPRPLIGTVMNSDGTTQLGIVESTTVDTDGTSSVQVTTSFTRPRVPAASAASVPLVSLQPIYTEGGGTVAVGSTWYYAVSAVDGSGAEGDMSFIVSANIPDGTNTYAVTLHNLSFSSTAVSFNVYRGAGPANLLQIADAVPIAAEFTDPGLTPQLQGPPDANFDHVNVYWRFVLRPEQLADIHTYNTIGATGAGMQANEYRGAVARITSGAGTGQERTIASNSESTLTVAPGWGIPPNGTSTFVVADASWQFGASATSSPVTFAVPNRTGAVIQVSGRSANVHDDECAYELSPLATWKISGGAGLFVDEDIPGKPTFALFATGQGIVEVLGIGFTDLTNTRGVLAGTLSLLFMDETIPPAPLSLAAELGNSDETASFSSAVSIGAGDVLLVDSELLVAAASVSEETSLEIIRNAYGTEAVTHAAGTLSYILARKTFVMPFPRDFFGTPSSGSYSYRAALPNVRITAADFFVTNSKGNSSVTQRAFTSTVDGGIRTLSGGQLSLQVDGPLAIQDDAVPPLIIDSAHSVRDVIANLGIAPTEASVDVQVIQNGQHYCALSIPAGATASNVVNGLTLPPLRAEDQIGLNILSVPQTADSRPGADLTVTIRL